MRFLQLPNRKRFPLQLRVDLQHLWGRRGSCAGPAGRGIDVLCHDVGTRYYEKCSIKPIMYIGIRINMIASYRSGK